MYFDAFKKGPRRTLNRRFTPLLWYLLREPFAMNNFHFDRSAVSRPGFGIIRPMLRTFSILGFLVLGLVISGNVQQTASSTPTTPGVRALAHFHHLHLNSTDPAEAINFYTSKFDCEKARFNAMDAVWSQKSWMFFTKVSRPPKSEITS